MTSLNRVTHANLARSFRGGERQTELLIRELAARGLPQSLVARRGGELERRLAGLDGLRIESVTTPWLPRPGRLLGDLVHAHEARAAHLAHLTHRLSGQPYLVTRRAWEQPGTGRLTRGVYRRAAAVVAISESVRAGLATYDPALSLHLIHSAAAPPASDPGTARRLRKRWRGRFVVGHAGALVDRHKGQSVLIRAARRLSSELPELLVVLLGEGPDEASLRREASGCGNVVFEGFSDDVGSYLAAFDVFAFPSRYEALGSSLLDAMTAGLPVVASRVDGIPEIVRHNEQGLLVPPGDDEALASAIRSLHGNPGLRQSLATGAQGRAADFTVARMADRYLSLYRSLVEGDAA